MQKLFWIVFGIIIWTSINANPLHSSKEKKQMTQTEMQKIIGIVPPDAKKIPHVTVVHNEKLVDDYFWLRDTQWPKVTAPDILNYLNAENAYSKAYKKHSQKNIDKIYQEIIGRIKLEDKSVPVKKNQYEYYHRTNKDSNYQIYCRKDLTKKDSTEEIILDANLLAKNTAYFDLGDVEISNDHQKLLYSVDLTGGDRYSAKVKDLTTGKLLSDNVDNTLGSLIWNKAGTGFFYSKLSDSWRTEEVYFHTLGEPQSKDRLIYKEKDPLFMVGVEQSGDKRYIFIVTQSKDSSEIRYIDLEKSINSGNIEPILIQARKNDHLYNVDHREGLFYILTNDKGKNFRLATTKVEKPGQENWKDLIPYDPKLYLQEFSLYKDNLVLSVRERGLTQIKIVPFEQIGPTQEALPQASIKEVIHFPDPSYSASLIYTTFEDNGARISYSSLVTPSSVMQYNFTNKKLDTLKVQEIPSGYDAKLYQTERVFAKSLDGTEVPISLVYKKSLFKKDGSNPLYLYGYGAYGIGIPASFRTSILSLLDRGFVYAIAHVRGGDEMGYLWYEDAKFLNKRRTFEDFLAVADFMSNQKYTSKGNITISGGSAGGMLIGVAINEKPDFFKIAVADVPFVDVLNTMLDDTLPLTPGEFKEWGNPKDLNYFRYIKSYSPYDNVKKQNYPSIYVTAGINDPRVTYWEPAKWVAKLRHMKTDNNVILLDVNMDAGHAGISGRFGQSKEIAEEYAFILANYGLL